MPQLEPVDLVFTDPPYPHKYIYFYSELSKHASKILKKNGMAFVYADNDYIPEVIACLGRFLNYRCMVHLNHTQSQILFSSRYNAKWKPIFVYCNGSWDSAPIVDGSVPPHGKDKRYHHWGQSMYEVIRIIDKHTNKDV
jgi:DNA modification methylase